MHPCHLVDAEDRLILQLAAALAGGGAGAGPLPFAGGAADQPAAVMRSIGVVAEARRRLQPKERGER